VELFPNDANAYDSLGEAFMMSGDSGAALTNYQISLDMNPNNDNAADMVAKLRGE
jgi:cytochrome c-type biogenesis protein CcmH/NrfG